MKEKWTQLLAEHLDPDRSQADRQSYLMKEQQAVTIVSGDTEIEVTHGEGYVFDIFDEALVLRSVGEGRPRRIPWDAINVISFSYAYAPASVTRSPGEEKPAPPPFAYPL